MIKKKVIAFNVSKQESHNTNNKYKKIHQFLRVDYKVVIHSDELLIDGIKSYDVLIIANPQVDFTIQEVNSLKQFIVQEGKSVAIFGSGNENNHSTIEFINLHTFLLEYGIKFENDTVVRTSFFKYLHPKHVFIDDAVLHPTFQTFKGSNFDDKDSLVQYDMDNSIDDEEEKFTIVYPDGSTLEANPPSLPILSSGSVSFPANRPIVAIWDASTVKATPGQKQSGKILVVGSSDMFADEWLEKEKNKHILDTLINFLLQNDMASFDRSQSSKDTRVDEPKTVPDIEALSERLKSCLQRNEPLPQDLSSLLCSDMLVFDTSLIPDVIDLYNALNVKKETLTLIPPEFELPIPPLKPAVFYPKMKEMPPPALDKFDLDEEFAESSVRLAHLYNTCSDDDCDYFIQEAGSIVGLLDETETDVDTKVILHTLFNTLVKFRTKRGMLENGHMPIKKIEIKQM